ncbi:MAG: hypothetical protein P8009_03825 [Gammaproteobacteria bacterium]
MSSVPWGRATIIWKLLEPRSIAATVSAAGVAPQYRRNLIMPAFVLLLP